MSPHLEILIGETQPEKAEVWTSTTQGLDNTGHSTANFISDCLQIATSKKHAIVKYIIVLEHNQ